MGQTWMVAGLLLAALLTSANSASAVNTLIPILAKDYVYDNTHETLFMTVNGSGKVERYDAAAKSLLSPLNAGANLSGIDITPDDQFLYIGEAAAGTTQGFIRKVNVTTGAKTNLPYNSNDGVLTLRIADNGKALFTLDSNGWPAVREIDLATGTITSRRTTHHDTSIDRGPDRSVLFFQEGRLQTGPIYTYDSDTDDFPASLSTGSSFGRRPAAVNRDGTQITFGNKLMDANLNTIGTLPGNIGGHTFDPLRDILYYADYGTEEIVAYDSNALSEIGRFPAGENIGSSSPMSMSLDANRLFIRTPSGVRMIDNPLSPNAIPSNASFDAVADLDIFNLDFGTVLLQEVATPMEMNFDISNLPGVGQISDLALTSFTGSGDTATLTTDLTPFANLAAGSSQSFTGTFDTSATGNFSATYDLSFTDILGTNQTMTLNISGVVEAPNPANASFATGFDQDVLDIDFGDIRVGDPASAIGFQIANLLSGDPTADLDLVSINASGDTGILTHDVVPFDDLTAGNDLSFMTNIDTSTIGAFGATYELNFTDFIGTDQTLTLNILGDVVLPEYPANASFSTSSDVDVLNIDFGTLGLNDAAGNIAFQIANLVSAGTTAHLDLIGIGGTGATSVLTSDLGPFDNLVAGSNHDFQAAFDTSLPGLFDASYELQFTDELGTSQTITLNLSGEVLLTDNPLAPNLIYNAVTGEVIIDPDGAGNIIGYSLKNTTDSFLPGNHTPVLGGIATSLVFELAEASLGAITLATSIGNVFPAGMDITMLYSLLSRNAVSTELGSPLLSFDLIVIGNTPSVPEPSTYAMAGMALVGLGFVRWRRKMGQVSVLALLLLVVASPASAANILIPVLAKDYVYDNTNEMLYMTVGGSGDVQRYDASAQSLLSPFNAGVSLTALDITPDDQYLYIGDASADRRNKGYVRKVNVDTGVTTDIPFSISGFEQGVQTLRIASNGKAFFSIHHNTWAPIREIDLASDTVTTRGSININSGIARGADRTTLFFQEGNVSTGRSFSYDANSDSFFNTFHTGSSNTGKPAAVNRNGDQMAFITSLMDDSLNVLEIFPNTIGGYTFDPLRDILYYADKSTDEIVAYDSAALVEIQRLPIGENITGSSPMSISEDTNRLFIRTPSGVRMIDNPLATSGLPSNASFDAVSDLGVLNLDFGTVIMQDAVAPIDFGITNLPAAGLTANLRLESFSGSGDTAALSTDLISFSILTADDTRPFQSVIDTSVPGNYSATYDLNFTDLAGTDQTLTLNISGIVATPDDSNASFASGFDQDILDINFGAVALNASVPAEAFQIANLFSTDPTARIDLVNISGSGDFGVLTTNLALFDDLDAGDFHDFQAMVDTSLPGPYNASYELSFTDLLGNDQTLTLNLHGAVTLPEDPSVPDLIYNAATGEVILDPDGAGGIIGYDLKNGSGAFLAGNHVPVLGGVATSVAGNLAEAAFGATTSPASIGNVFPLGMDLADLYLLLSTNQVSTALGAPLISFDLFVVGGGPAVPELSTYAMAGLALAGLGFVGWRRRKTNRDQIPRLAATSRATLAVLICLLVASSAQAAPIVTFSTPVNLGPTINTSANDRTPSLSSDGLTLYFSSDRGGGSGNYDLWAASRPSTSDPFGSPVNLGGSVNGSRSDKMPEVSSDGLTLYFGSTRNSNPNSDVFVSTRASTSDPWGTAQPLPGPLNSSSDDGNPSISTDGLALYFQSSRPGGLGEYDIWVSSRASTADNFGAPTNVPAPVNTSFREGPADISTDGLMLFFDSRRPGGIGSDSLWMTSRNSVSDPFSAATYLGAVLDSTSRDIEPNLSYDGQTLLFTSPRSGGEGGMDIWMSTVQIGSPVPEPSTYVMGALALAGLGFIGWRGRRRNR